MGNAVSERDIQLYWLCTVERGSTLSLTDGRRVEILSPGILNRDAGPDFSNARIRIGGEVWAGNVEMHVRATDWYRHGHENDPAYSNVVLHVVAQSDGFVTGTDGTPLPQAEITLPEGFADSVAFLSVPGEPYMRCAAIEGFWKSLTPLQIRDWMESLFAMRCRSRGDRLLEILHQQNGDWRQAAFVFLSRALGFGVNADPMEALALSIPLNTLERHSSSLFQLEALLFGQAGLLPGGDSIFDDYYNSLAAEYGFLSHKYSLRPPSGLGWKMARTRPANFPYRRIAQLAAFCHGGFTLPGEIVENAADVEKLTALMMREPSEYWLTHHTFHSDRVCAPQKITLQSARMLCINAAAPYLLAYGRQEGRSDLADAAENLLRTLPPEETSRMKVWKRAGAPVECAADTQSLHHLFATFCSHNRCLECRLGARLLRYQTERSRGLRVAIAFDSFKGSVSGWKLSQTLATALNHIGFRAEAYPLADGGEGTAEALRRLKGGRTEKILTVDAFGTPIEAAFVLLDNGEAAVDMASCCGLGAAEGTAKAQVMEASSFGLGRMIREIQRRYNPRRIVVGLGGSASCDGGIGFLQALGASFGFEGEMPEMLRSRNLGAITSIDLGTIAPLPEMLFLHDVDAPLTGPDGAARRFAPQKGATPQQVEWLEANLTRLAGIASQTLGKEVNVLLYGKGHGAAGGMGMAASLLGAKLLPGAPFIADMLAPELRRADLVITGEGRTDASSLLGKAPCVLGSTAARLMRPAWLFSGSITLNKTRLRDAGFAKAIPLAHGTVSARDLNAVITLRRLIYAAVPELLSAAQR